MVLHLLGKKSWNVYNQANIDRVRRDEAAAAAAEEEADRRLRDDDARERRALLRGEPLSPRLPSAQSTLEAATAAASLSKLDREREQQLKRHQKSARKRRGEDDTDRDIRVARQDAEAADAVRETLGAPEPGRKRQREEVDVVDGRGHIQLFAPPSESRDDGEPRKRIKPSHEFDPTMRFIDAAGKKVGSDKPWYASSTPARSRGSGLSAPVQVDARNDPFAVMQKAQSQLRQAEADRLRWRKEREEDVGDIVTPHARKGRGEKRSSSRSARHQKRRHEGERDSSRRDVQSEDSRRRDGARDPTVVNQRRNDG